MKLTPTILLALLPLVLSACNGIRPPKPVPPPEPWQPVLQNYEVHHVRLARPVRIEDREVQEAWLVSLTMDAPPFYGPAVRLWIGDFAVPEYGGLPDGVYFRLYDRDQVARLQGGEFGYSIDQGTRASFGVQFEPGLDTKKLESERDVMDRLRQSKK